MQADHDCFGAVIGSEFGEDIVDVEFDRSFGDKQGVRRFLIGLARGNFAEDFALALRERQRSILFIPLERESR